MRTPHAWRYRRNPAGSAHKCDAHCSEREAPGSPALPRRHANKAVDALRHRPDRTRDRSRDRPSSRRNSLAGSGHLREFGLHFLFVGEQLPDAGPLLHPLEMRGAMLELRLVEIEKRTAPEAPEEMGIGRREVIEEEFAPGEQIVGDLEFLEQLLLR